MHGMVRRFPIKLLNIVPYGEDRAGLRPLHSHNHVVRDRRAGCQIDEADNVHC